MKTSLTRVVRRTERGSVAVEAAIILPILILFIAVPLFIARVFWYYSVAEKAAHDAARFVASATQQEMLDTSSMITPVSLLAIGIANAELEEIRPLLSKKGVSVTCDGAICTGQATQWVRGYVQIGIRDDFLGNFTNVIFGDDGLILTADVTMRYAGN
jgi:Flp pilus assembly protein TadG